LKIDTLIQEDHQAKLTVEFEASQLEEAKKRAARKIARQTKIPGFRPGKAPYGIVLRTVGEGTILEEAMEILVDDQYPKVLEESKIKPYGPGQLKNVVTLEPPTFEFLIPLEAEVILGDYQNIRFPYQLTPVVEQDLDNVIADLRERQAILEPVERAAQESDQVFIRISGERLDTPEGESSTLVTDRPMPVTIVAEDAETKSEWPFPGFSRQLIELKAGDQKTIHHTFSVDSEFSNLRGITARFNWLVESVKSRTLPDLTAEFAHTVGEYETVEALRAEIRKSLETERKDEYDSNYGDKIMDELFKIAVLKYPPQMLEHECDIFQVQLEKRLSQQNMDLTTYLKIRQLDEAGLKAEIIPLAEQRMKRTLILLEIARQHDIKVSEEQLEAESIRTLDQLSHMLPPDKVRKTMTNEFVRGMIGNISADLLIKLTWDYLHQIARGEISALTVEEPVSEPPKKKRAKRKVEES
jgi:trigger factor